jgi:hypothetical protein
MTTRRTRRPQPRLRTASAIAASAVSFVLVSTSTASAQAPFYENQQVSYGDETVTLDAPAAWDRQQLNEHSVGFLNYTAPGKRIVLDLAPLVDTVAEMKAERRTLRDLGPRYYREVGFRVNDPGRKVRVRWVFSYRDAQTDDTWSFTSYYLMHGNRLEVDGRQTQRDRLVTIRDHVVRSVRFPAA